MGVVRDGRCSNCHQIRESGVGLEDVFVLGPDEVEWFLSATMASVAE